MGGDDWIIRLDEDDETLYLLEIDPVEVWTETPSVAASFSNAAAKRIIRELDGRKMKAVRRFEELKR